MDVHDKTTRSYNMSKIRSKGTKPELTVRKICFGMGLRYRLNKKIFNVSADLVFPKYKIAIFVHGCFWHVHQCKYGLVKPKSNIEFWQNKRESTIRRDQANQLTLIRNNWRPLIIWECELKEEPKVRDRIVKYFKLNVT